MKARRRLRHEYHEGFRAVMRVVGPILIVVGGAMFVTGIISFSSHFDERPNFPWERTEPGAPDRFWMCFVGMPLAMAGIFCTRIGFLGAAARYVAGEVAPVARDTIDYVVDGTRESIREVADAIRGDGPGTPCPACGADNEANAKFCDQCGGALARACRKCGETNDADARFCDACGTKL